MAKIKNTVDIDVKERGSAKAAKGIEGVTKAQTRQTNAGVSASKQFSAQAQGEFGAESPIPGREKEYKAFKDRQASNPIAGRAASPPPPIDADRKKRSPGISTNFYDRSQADFKRPFGT